MAKTFVEAEKSSVMPGGGVVPLRMPAGALSYLDRNQYISNMEVVAYFPGVNLMIFGDEHSCLWAKGKRRMIAFQGGWLDITEPTKATVVKESGLGSVSELRLQQAAQEVDLGRLTPDAADAGNAGNIRAANITRNMPRSRSMIPDFAASRPTTSPIPTRPNCSTNSRLARPASACIARSTTAASTAISLPAGTTNCAWKAPSASTATA